VRDSRRLLKKSVKLRDVVHKQVAHYQDKKDVEGRKYNGWWSIWDVLRGVKPGKHYTRRAKEIAHDAKQIIAPATDAAEKGRYGPIVSVLKGADESFSTKYTKELGSPALDLATNPHFDGYVEKPLAGARVKFIPYNPRKPYDNHHRWTKTPSLSRLPEIKDEPYTNDLSPIYAHDFKIKPRHREETKIPFDLKTKNWDTKHIPYTYPVTMVKHNPRLHNPHVRKPTPGWHEDWPEYEHHYNAMVEEAATAPADAPQAEAPAEGPMATPL